MTHQEFEERLDEIAENLQNGARDNRKFSVELATELATAKQAIRELFVELIGDFDPTGATALTEKLRTTITGKEGGE